MWSPRSTTAVTIARRSSTTTGRRTWDETRGRFVARDDATTEAYDATTMTYESEDEDGKEVRRAVATFDAINADKRAEENLERADGGGASGWRRRRGRRKAAKVRREEAASARGFERVNAEEGVERGVRGGIAERCDGGGIV